MKINVAIKANQVMALPLLARFNIWPHTEAKRPKWVVGVRLLMKINTNLTTPARLGKMFCMKLFAHRVQVYGGKCCDQGLSRRRRLKTIDDLLKLTLQS